MIRPAHIVSWLTLAMALVITTPGRADSRDYDVQSSDWNGMQELVRVAQASDVELRPTTTLDWSEIRRGDGLMVVYPRSRLDLPDLSSFLEDGGRLALLDDFGDAGPLFQWFQVSRTEQVHGRPRSTQVPGLLIAERRMDHPLSEGVDMLVTNEPVALSHPRLTPIFALSDDPTQGVVLAGQVGHGRLVVGGDPSVLINTMMRFQGNKQFARNLLSYLAGHPGGRVWLVSSSFGVTGVYRGRHPQNWASAVIQNFDDLLGRLSNLGWTASIVRSLALLIAAFAAAVLLRRTWGARPSDRFGPTGPSGAAAGVADKVAIFSLAGANLLYPTLIAKRHFERSLLRSVGLKPPTDIGAVLTRARGRLSEDQQTELRALLVDLDQLSTPAHEGGPARVAPRRFLSLWRRINAILGALGNG